MTYQELLTHLKRALARGLKHLRNYPLKTYMFQHPLLVLFTYWLLTQGMTAIRTHQWVIGLAYFSLTCLMGAVAYDLNTPLSLKQRLTTVLKGFLFLNVSELFLCLCQLTPTLLRSDFAPETLWHVLLPLILNLSFFWVVLTQYVTPSSSKKTS